MPLFPEHIIREVTEKNDIIDVISQTVSLKKNGSSYIGLCPFHHEKTPSFSVSPRRGIFKCFGCGEGGDVIGFVMKSENVSFHEAVTRLAQRSGITLPEANVKDAQEAQKRKERAELLHSINKDAAEFYYANVKNSPRIIDYFKKRQISAEAVKAFWLGYSPDSWTAVFDYLKAKGYTEGDIYDAGLVQRHDSGRYYDFFRNRLMITVFDANSNVVGFSARVLDDSKPKYLNTRETAIFSKQRNLYGLNIARKSKKNYCILCEGCMDAIALISYGYDSAVAPLGTSFTEEQAKAISRCFEEAVICFDSDTAGRKATNRAITILRAFPNLKITVLDLKARKDPDEYIKEYGKARFDAMFASRKPDMEYLIEYFGEEYNLKKSEDKIRYISLLADYLKLISSDVELEVYANIISEKTGVQASSIIAQTGMRKSGATVSAADNVDITNVVNKGSVPQDNRQYIEKTRALLLSTIFYEPKLYGKYASVISESMFENPMHLVIFRYIKECYDNRVPVSNNAILSKFDTKEDINAVSGILALDIQSDDTDKAVSDYINQIKQKAGPEKALELLSKGEITLEQFNAIINNKG